MKVSEFCEILAGSMAVVRKKFNQRCRRISKEESVVVLSRKFTETIPNLVKNLVPTQILYIWPTVVECKKIWT